MALFGLSHKEDSFLHQLRLQAEKTVECISFLEKNMHHITEVAINEKKKMLADLIEIKMVLMDNLHKTFITPIDREDIYHISISMFDMANYSLTVLEEMHLLNVEPDIFIQDMVEKVRVEAEELLMGIERLLKNPLITYNHIVEVTKKEKKVERIYRNAVKSLFDDKVRLEKDLQSVLYTQEVYRHVSNMSNKAETAANILGIALIKLS